jgi:TetR/AcrR family transcriptional regulator, tetracycline repressor protein
MIVRMARPKQPVLTRDKVVDAAIAVIGADGLESFSMPRLAKRLGVSAPSLYHHFGGKDELLAEVARSVATPDPPTGLPADAHWTDYLISMSVALRRKIVAHPHCAPLLVRFMPKDNMLDEYEQMCRFLAAAGVPSRLHVRIVDGMTALTIGAAFLNENAAHYTRTGDGPTADATAHPLLCAALDAVGTATAEEQFERYLRTYLDGVLAEMPGQPPSAD